MHSHADIQPTLDTSDSRLGLRVVKITFVALLLTSIVEGVITLISGSTALFADTVHSIFNTLTTLPLWLAFYLARKQPTRHFTYGFHRAEDLAGLSIIVFMTIAAGVVGYESIRKIIDQQEPTHLAYALAAGVVGVVVNELIAQYRIKVGKAIGSAALVADGHHARFDGLGSLAVVLGLIVVMAGFPLADPIIGLVITALLVYLLVQEAGPAVLARAMDRIDPEILAQLTRTASAVDGVHGVYEIRVRWIGHRLLAQLSIGVDSHLTVGKGHDIAVEVQHELMHAVPKLQLCTIHVEPFESGEAAGHLSIAHHFEDESPHDDEDH